jgi:hypothetical protein
LKHFQNIEFITFQELHFSIYFHFADFLSGNTFWWIRCSGKKFEKLFVVSINVYRNIETEIFPVIDTNSNFALAEIDFTRIFF